LVICASSSANGAFLSNTDRMRPDVVANTLVKVEEEWRAQAALFLKGSSEESKEAPRAFAKSCSSVVAAVIQGSGGDRNVAKEYMGNVCNQKVLAGWHKLRCGALTNEITEHGMLGTNYANRQHANPMNVCTSFWSVFLETEKHREADEAKLQAEQEKLRAEEQKKTAVVAAEAKKKADAEAKVVAKNLAKEEARLEQEQKKKEAKLVVAEAEEKAKLAAAEAKHRAVQAGARLALKKAEALKFQMEAAQKLEEAVKAEKDHKSRVAEHKKAEAKLHAAQKPAAKPVAKPVAVAPKPAAKPAEVPKPAAKPMVPAKVAASTKKADAVKDASKVKKVVAVAAKKAALLEQDPCAGCTTGLAQAYQTCAMKHGNPCAETNAAGIVGSGPGQKKDIGCCMKKEKHDRCLTCSAMDCAHGTCNVNKKYYNTYAMSEKFDDKKAMKKAGWGK